MPLSMKKRAFAPAERPVQLFERQLRGACVGGAAPVIVGAEHDAGQVGRPEEARVLDAGAIGELVVADTREDAALARSGASMSKNVCHCAGDAAVLDEVARVEEEARRRRDHRANDRGMGSVVGAVVAVDEEAERRVAVLTRRGDERAVPRRAVRARR